MHILTETSFSVGSNGILKCVVEANENINQISWSKNNVKLQTNKKYNIEKNSLIVHNVNLDDSGEYTCKVNIGPNNVISYKTINIKAYGNILN